MSTLQNLLDIPAYFDPIDRIEGAISTFINADWKGAYRRRGVWGIMREFISCVVSYNAPEIMISRYSRWRGIDVERLLARFGIRIWGRGIASNNLYFSVKRRQVVWAETVLVRNGVPVVSRLHKGATDGKAPVAWKDRNRGR